MRLSGSFLSFVLAMALLGPAPAVALARRLRALRRRVSARARSTARWSTSATFATFALPGGLLMRVLLGDFDADGPAVVRRRRAVTFLVDQHAQFPDGRRRPRLHLRRDDPQILRSFVTALPSEFATALLTAGVAFTYGHLGIGVRRPGRRRPASSSCTSCAPACRPTSAARSSSSAPASWRRCRSACSRRCCRPCRCATR